MTVSVAREMGDYWSTSSDAQLTADFPVSCRQGARPWMHLDLGEPQRNGQIVSGLSLALLRPTPVLLNLWLSTFPLEDHGEAWKPLLMDCRQHRVVKTHSAQPDRPLTTIHVDSALAVAWTNPQPWAVKALAGWIQEHALHLPEETWALQVERALKEHCRTTLPFNPQTAGHPWQTLKAIASQWHGWPGPSEAWAPLDEHKRARDLSTWEAWAIRRDDANLLETLLENGCGLAHALPVSTVHMGELSPEVSGPLHHLFARAIGTEGPGAFGITNWFVQRTDILSQPPKGPSLPYWNVPTWRAAIEARAGDGGGGSRASGLGQAYAAALALIRSTETPSPPPRPRSRLRT